MTTLPTNRADREAGNVARADASEGMQAFKERQAARFRALEALDSEAKALAEKVKQMKKTNKGNRYIGDALSRAEEKARRAVGSVGVAINDLKNGNAYRFEEMKSGAESAIREAAAAVAGAAGMRQDEAAPSLNAVIDSMSEQLNSIGQAAKGIVERFAPRADAVDRRQIEKLIDELKAAGSAPRIKYDNEGRIELIDGLDPISFYERNKGSTAFEPGRRK